MGKSGVRLVTRFPPEGGISGDTMILCPWLAGPDPQTRFWLGVLSWHDANASLLASLDAMRGHPAAGNVFAALFCADPFRDPRALFQRLRASGIGGVVNLPSVTFLDGALAGILQQFQLGPERELRFLRLAQDAGLRVAGCVASREMARELAELGAEFAIVHNGPPLMESAPELAEALLLRRFAGVGLPIVPATSLLQTLCASSAGCSIHRGSDMP